MSGEDIGEPFFIGRPRGLKLWLGRLKRVTMLSGGLYLVIRGAFYE